MRTTNNMMSRQLMTNIFSNYNKMMKHHMQVTTGKAFQYPSENPYDAIKICDLNFKYDKNERYKDNVSQALGVVKEIEGGLTAVNESLADIKELINQSMNGSNGKDERQIMARVIQAHKENIISQLNREYSGKYIFGGLNTSETPLKSATGQVTYNGVNLTDMTDERFDNFLQDSITMAVSEGIGFDSSFSALKVTGFGNENLFCMLDNIINELNSDDFQVEKLMVPGKFNEDALTSVQKMIAEIGGKASRLEALDKKLSNNELSILTLITETEGVDIEKAVIDFKTAEMVYHAALSTTARIIQPTILDYLR